MSSKGMPTVSFGSATPDWVMAAAGEAEYNMGIMKLEKSDLQAAANAIRVLVADMVERANSGHPGGSMGQADVAATLDRP